MNTPALVFTVGLSFFLTEFITLEDLKWKNRVVLIFPNRQEGVVDFSDSLKREMLSRDIVYFIFTDSLHSNTDYVFEERYIDQLKSRYLLGTKASCWVLLGKDGSLKLRREEELDLTEAFSTVDAMPAKSDMGSWE